MTQEKLIIFLMFLLLLELLCMRYFWLRSEKDEEEIKELNAEIKELKGEIERKDRLLEAWEKSVSDNSYLEQLRTLPSVERSVYLMGKWRIPSHPCEGCDTGWGSANSEGITTCHDTCEKLAAWREAKKKED